MEAVAVENGGAGEGVADEVSLTPAAEDQPINDETVEVETAAGGDNSVESLKEGTVLEPESLEPETSPGEKKIDDPMEEMSQPLSSNDDNILLNFGVGGGGVAEVSNQESAAPDSTEIQQETTVSNDFDLLGFAQPEPTNPAPSNDETANLGTGEIINNVSPEPVSDLLGDAMLLGNQSEAIDNSTGATASPEPVSDLLGLSTEENVNIKDQQMPEPTDAIQPEPESAPAEEEMEKPVEGTTPADNDENTPANEDGTVEEQLPAQEEGERPVEDSISAEVIDGNDSTNNDVAFVEQPPTYVMTEKPEEDSTPAEIPNEIAPTTEDATMEQPLADLVSEEPAEDSIPSQMPDENTPAEEDVTTDQPLAPVDVVSEVPVENSAPAEIPDGNTNKDATVEQEPIDLEAEKTADCIAPTDIPDDISPMNNNATSVEQLSSKVEAEKAVVDSPPTDITDGNTSMDKDATLEPLAAKSEDTSAPNHGNTFAEKDENSPTSETSEANSSMVETGPEAQEIAGESSDNKGGETIVVEQKETPLSVDETSTVPVTSGATIVAIPPLVVNEQSAEMDAPIMSPSIPANGEQPTVESASNLSGGEANEEAEERTEEEEEWLSMGLGLGDALRQIVALTEERDSFLAICKEKEDGKVQAEGLLVEVQSRLMAEMNGRAEYASEVRQVRETLKKYEERLKTYEGMEDDLEKAQASLVQVVTEKSKIEMEVQKLREIRDESEQKEVVLSNRLNDAKKKEANKSTAAGRLEVDNEALREDLQKTKQELDSTKKAKAKLESNMEKLKAKAVERVKQAETALAEERELNEERKKKMKVFVETKAEELRDSKEGSNDVQKELEETRSSLRSSRDREEAFHKELDSARLKYRELQRDMERMKRNSEQLHKMGNSLEQELEKTASETEEHKKKRMSAKHEIMQMVRTLDTERAVSSKLKESVKFTFTPKALSQQELLTECLRDFELELEKLAAKMGKSLLPSPDSSEQAPSAPIDGLGTPDINGVSRKSKKTRGNKADVDTDRLISNLEQETQNVSKGIMALTGSIERMRSLLNDDDMFGCMTYLSNILAGTGEARHQRLEGDHEEHNSGHFV